MFLEVGIGIVMTRVPAFRAHTAFVREFMERHCHFCERWQELPRAAEISQIPKACPLNSLKSLVHSQ
jgi:hypothetical protein